MFDQFERYAPGTKAKVGRARPVSVELVWHRGDLRTHDHAALHAAASTGSPVAGVVVLDSAILDATSARRRALFHENVRALRASYERLGSVLLVRAGLPSEQLPVLAAELGVTHMHALRSHTPYGTHRDELATRALHGAGVRLHWHDGLYLHAPGTVLTRDGRPFAVYGAFARRWWELAVPEPLPAPRSLRAPSSLSEAGVIPHETSDVPMPKAGEDAALARLETFVVEKLDDYATRRDRLDGAGLSRLSIDFALGTLSPRVAFHRVSAHGADGAKKWLAELLWRDFLADLLAQRPWLATRAFDARFDALRWSDDDAALAAWRDGRTGIPAVDAAMRELNATGWISNRARMVAAQFLTKHLRIHWTKGEAMFRRQLLDGDAASNIGNWQWAAGLGVDNAPYFRVFNPVTQARTHDPDGAWLMRWAPECGGDARPMAHAIVDPAEARRGYLEWVKGAARPGR